MKEKIKELSQKRNILDIVIVLLISIIICLPMISNKQDVYFDDGIQHIARSFGTFESIKNGNFKIISGFANNFGYSWNLFYGPLTTYGIILIKLIVNNFIVAYKIFVFLLLFLSGITMYKLLYSMTSERNIALLSSGIYILAPYHLTDLYVRNALGELTSFVFIPLVFLGIYNLFNSSDKNYYLSLGAIGLILCHNLSTAITAIFAFIYLIVNINELKRKKVVKDLLINLLFIILVTSFFWIPMLETKYSADYAVYEEGGMSTSELTAERGINIRDLFISSGESFFRFDIGPCLVLLAFSIMPIRVLNNNRKEYILFLIFAFLSLFMATKYFPWKYLPEKLSIIQFPWRMLEFSSFFLSIICSINAYVLIKKFSILDIIIMILILIIYNGIPAVFNSENVTNIEDLNLGIVSGIQDENVAGIARGEYLPTKANNNRFYIATREDTVNVIRGKAIIENEEKNSKTFKFKVNNLETTEYEAPYIYYPGYKITIDGIKLDSYETENGFLGFKIEDKTEGTLEITYDGTILMKISYIISIASTILLAIYIWRKH